MEQVPAGDAEILSAQPAAGFWIRVLAFVIDMVVIQLVTVAPSLLLARLGVTTLLLGLVPLCYYVVLWSNLSPLRPGRTVGNRLCRIQVVGVDGRDLSVGQGMLRFLALILSVDVFLLGVLWIVVDRQRRGWHDQIAGTRVVKT